MSSKIDPDQFEKAVASHNLKVGGSKGDRVLVLLGATLLGVSVLGTFLAYNVSLSQTDTRDIASTQILVVAMVGIAVVGGALFIAGSLTRVLRLWLLRQLLEGRVRDERLAELVDTSLADGTPDSR